MEITLRSPTSWVESESCLFLLKSVPCVREYNSKFKATEELEMNMAAFLLF